MFLQADQVLLPLALKASQKCGAMWRTYFDDDQSCKTQSSQPDQATTLLIQFGSAPVLHQHISQSIHDVIYENRGLLNTGGQVLAKPAHEKALLEAKGGGGGKTPKAFPYLNH